MYKTIAATAAAGILFLSGCGAGGGVEQPGSVAAAQSSVTQSSEDIANPSTGSTEAKGDTSSTQESSGPIERKPGGIMASGPGFSTLDQMVATSDLVVTGTVTEVLPGRVIEPETMSPGDSYIDSIGNEGTMPITMPNEPEDDVESYPTRFPETVVKVDEVLKGRAPETDAISVETLELAYGSPREPEWRQSGKRVLLFISHSREKKPRDIYVMAGPSFEETAYIVRDKDLVATIRSPLSNRVAKLSLPELRRQVEQAKARISRYEVQPLRPGSMQPRP